MDHGPMPPLLTSCPPALRRPDQLGGDVGNAYQRECVDSWRNAGFRPYSVNSQREADAGLRLPDGVQPLLVENDASKRLGRSLPLVSDLLRFGAQLSTSGGFAITNADILLDPKFDLAALVRDLPRGRAVVAPRVDVEGPLSRSGTTYELGFDFVALHAEDALALPDFGLFIGAPWWDHFLPTALALLGVEVWVAEEPFVYHLRHDERWNWDWWSDLGRSYADLLEQWAPLISSANGTLSLRRDLRCALNRPGARAVVRRWLGMVTKARRQSELVRRLHALSAAGVSHFNTRCVRACKPDSGSRA